MKTKNFFGKRALSLLLTFLMVLSLVPLSVFSAFAEDNYVAVASETYTKYNIESTDYPKDSYGSYYLLINKDGNYHIYGSNAQTHTKIIVAQGVEATIILENVNIKCNDSGAAPAITLNKNTNVTFRLAGENEVVGALSCAAIKVPDTATLTITSVNGDGATEGTLKATALPFPITDSNLSAMSRVVGCGGAGIGADGLSMIGIDYAPTLGNIIINGGKVEATGATGGAGIGGAGLSTTGSITINGGIVNASVDSTSVYASGAAIGGGATGYVPEITINGGLVEAVSPYYGAAIGSGWYSDDLEYDFDVFNYGDIRINGGVINASSIGLGYVSGEGAYSANGSVTITGGSVRAYQVTDPKNGRGIALTYREYTEPGLSGNTPVNDIILSDGTTYGTNDVFAQEGKLYLWLASGVSVRDVEYDSDYIQAYWGSSIQYLPYCGELSTAISEACAENSTIRYIKLNTEATIEKSISKGEFTLDLNGNILRGNLLIGNNADITLTDSLGGGELISDNNAVHVREGAIVTINSGKYSGKSSVVTVNDETSSVIINGGEFSTDDFYVMSNRGTLSIYGGTVSGGTHASIYSDGVTVVSDVRFTDNSNCAIRYDGGSVDLSDSSNVGLALWNTSGEAITMPCEQIKIPQGSIFFDSSNLPCNTLGNGYQYTIAAEPNKYNVSFDTNGGSGVMESVALYEGYSEFKLPDCDFTAPKGKVFVGWSYSANGEVIVSDKIYITADTTLYAQWVEGEAVWGTDKNNLTSVGTLSQALEANDGYYIKLVNDSVITSPHYFYRDVVIDLNGQTIYVQSQDIPFRVTEGYTLTLEDSAGGARMESSPDTNIRYMYVQSGGKLIVHGGTYESAVDCLCYISSGAEAEITGGNFISSSFPVENEGTLTVSGDSYFKGGWCSIVLSQGTLILKGGNLTSGQFGAVRYLKGLVDFSQYPDPNGIGISNYCSGTSAFPNGKVTVNVSDDNIRLGTGYVMKDANGATVTALIYGNIYTIGIDGTAYSISAESSENGTISVSKSQAGAGMTVIVTVVPDEDYFVDSLTVGNGVSVSKLSDNVYTFTMPSSDVNVTAQFKIIHNCNFDENGFCTVCDVFEPATDENEDGVYEISNAGQLYWFADKVNNDNANFGSANAILTADIVVNEGTMTAESTDVRVWTPIGNNNNKYTGTFDGNGKTVSGLYCEMSDSKFVGFFGYAGEGSEIKNIGVINSYFNGGTRVGSVAGVTYGLIDNSYSTSDVNGSGGVGGVAGFNHGTITNCYNTGTVSGGSQIGGMIGTNYSIINNCYNTGTVNSSEFAGGIVGIVESGSVSDCYNTGAVTNSRGYSGGVAAFNNGTITNCYYLNTAYSGGINSSDSSGSAEAKTAQQFKSGEVAYLLQGEQEEEIWGQKIGTDQLPVLGGDKVYYGYTSCAYDSEMVYTNTEVSDVRPAHKEFRAEFTWDEPYDGECYVSVELYCAECGAYVDSGSGYATLKETSEAEDCMHPGSELYEVIFEYEGVTYTDTKSFALKSDNHTGELVNGFCSDCGGFEAAKLNDNGTPDDEWDDYYEISNAGQLYWFAEHAINDQYARAVLTDDIIVNEDLNAENLREWISIGESSSMPYCGSFDGQGHTISGLYAKSELNYIGLFGAIGWGASISNLGIKDSYFEGNYYVGGIVGYNDFSNVKNCYAENVEIVAVGSGAALVGYNYGEVSNSYSTSGIIADTDYGTITNCYYLADVETEDGGKTAEQFNSGEVAYLLQSGVVGEEIWDDELGEYVQTEPEHIWGQKIGEDTYPVFGGDKVYQVENCVGELAYSNTEGEILDHDFENGFCTLCGGFEPAPLNEDGVYEIGNAGQLYWFADKVNNDNANFGSANAILTADIVVNEGTITSESTDARAWTPIGNNSNRYTGTFDGNNKTVSGLYFNNTDTKYVGLFGYIGENGTVKNTGVINSYFNGLWFVGGVVGANYGTITNCYNSGEVSGVYFTGGIVGQNCGTITSCYNTGIIEGFEFIGGVVGSNNGTITNCYNIGEVSGSYEVGGVVGKNSEGIISNCYNTGEVSGANDYIGGVAGANQTGTITNCYYLDTAYAGGIGKNNTVEAEDIVGSAEAKTAEQFASGEVAYLLQGEQTEDIWGQKISTDTYPVFGGDKVYTVNNCNDEVVGYSNTEGEILDHDFENGFCTVCGGYEPAPLNEDGVYEIGNAGQLYWFAEYVNAGNVSADAILTADIVVNEGTVTESSTDARVWTPIGNWSNKYTGTFDGNDYTVSGLYFNDSEVHYVGLFGVIGENGAVKNTGVINSYFNADKCVGGVSGYNFGTVTNCYNTAEISADNIVGGIVGCNYGIVANSYNTGKVNGNNGVSGVVGVSQYGTIINCYNTGEVSGTSNVGGILGESYSATIANCYNTGTVNGNYYFGAIFGYGRNYDAENCYYLDSSCSFGTGDDSIYGPITSKAKTSEAFASGEVAYLLQGEQTESVWGQKIGEDTYPVLSGDKVYYVTNCKSENIYSNTNENDQHNVVDDSCTNCGLSSSTVMEIKLIKLAIKRANEIADENNVLESKKEPLDDIYQDLLEVGKQEESSQLSKLAMVKIELSAYNQKLQAGIADGTWVKADYTEIDAAVAEIESSGATTDKMSAKLDEIKSELSVMKESSETSKADVDVLMKEVETLKDCVSGNHIFENGKCTICGAEEYVDQLAGYSLSLGDKIAVNYYMSLTDKTLNDANAKMVFTVPDTGSTYTVEIPVSEAVKSGDYYVFTCEVAAKEMTSEIKAKLVTSSGELILEDYTVAAYAEEILSNPDEFAKEQALVKAMLNFGAQAQTYFGYKMENLANATTLMTPEEKKISDFTFSSVEGSYTISGSEAGVTYYGTALDLESQTQFKHYFIVDESVDVENLEIQCNYPASIRKNGSFYEITISGIPVHQMMSSDLDVSFGGLTLDYTLNSYGAKAYASGNEALYLTVSALAYFAVEASDYSF